MNNVNLKAINYVKLEFRNVKELGFNIVLRLVIKIYRMEYMHISAKQFKLYVENTSHFPFTDDQIIYSRNIDVGFCLLK